MIVEIVTVSYENYASYLFEVDDDLVESEIKQRIFEAFREAYYERESEYRDAESVIMSQDFHKGLEKRGFKRIKANISFMFWGWNTIQEQELWEESDELDKELWEFVRAGKRGDGDV